MIDTMEAAVSYLLTQSGVTSLVGTRIRDALPVNYNGSDKTLLLIEDGGPGSLDVPLARTRLSVRSYAATGPLARGVFRAVYDALHRAGPVAVAVTGGNVYLGRGSLEAGPFDLQEPETEWRFCLATFELVWTDRTVA